MASFLVRLWRDVLGKDCPTGSANPFTDIAGSGHRADIECAHALGITKDFTSVTYLPESRLTTSQISRFLFRTYQQAGNSCPEVDGELDKAVGCLFTRGVVPTIAEAYSEEAVTRAEMAVYVIGLWHNLAGRGLPPGPPLRPTRGGNTLATISAGYYHSCGIRSDGAATCWAGNGDGQSDVPSVAVTAISAGFDYSCGVGSDGALTCWGNNRYGQVDVDGQSGTFTRITAGARHSCGIRTDARAICWGQYRYGESDLQFGRFTRKSAGRYHSCGIRRDGTATCWGSNRYGQLDAPAGTFTAIAAGGYHSCGIRGDGAAICWGNNRYGQLEAPAGSFAAIAAGGSHSCGIRAGGTATCWVETNTGSRTAIRLVQYDQRGRRLFLRHTDRWWYRCLLGQ